MASIDWPNDAHAQAIAYLRQRQGEYDHARTPNELQWLLIGCVEYRERGLAHLPDLHAPFDQLIAQLRKDNAAFDQLYANDPFIRNAVDDRNSIATKQTATGPAIIPTADRLRLHPLTVPELRELVLRCDAQFRMNAWPAKVIDFLHGVTQRAQGVLAQKLGHEDTFLTLEFAYKPPLARYDDDDEGIHPQWLWNDIGERTVAVTLALADYWMLFWLAQRLTRVELERLYTFGRAPRANLPLLEAFPMDAEYALLRAFQNDPPIGDIRTALEIFTYDLLGIGLITYQEAAALASEALRAPVNVDAWAKRVSRWADRNRRPRLDGRKIVVATGSKSAGQPFGWRKHTLHLASASDTI